MHLRVKFGQSTETTEPMNGRHYLFDSLVHFLRQFKLFNYAVTSSYMPNFYSFLT